MLTAEGLLTEEEAVPGRLAMLLYVQLEAEAADEPLLSQATKNLVFLAPRLLAADAAAGRVPQPAPAAGGAAEPAATEPDAAAAASRNAAGDADGDDVDADVDEDDMDADEEGAVERGGGGGGALTLHGLVRRMARLADERAWPRQDARLAALRFSAALASRLGGDAVAPYLPTMLLPLFRITESNAANPDEVPYLTTSPKFSRRSCPAVMKARHCSSHLS